MKTALAMTAATGAAILLLTACGSTVSDDMPASNTFVPPAPTVGDTGNRATVSSATANEAQVDAALGGIVAVDKGAAAPGVPVERPKRPFEIRREAREFPTAFLGKWGLVHADCDLSRTDDAKGVMKIEPGKVTFYEASALVSAMPSKRPYTLTADLDFKGEGRTWQRREQFALEVAGTTLIRTEPGTGGAARRSFRYERC